MTLFSIAVHEQPLVILNQVENFRYFNPDCSIVLHFSASMPAEEYEKTLNLLKGKSFVFINETRLWSGYGDGTQMKMHVVNYLFAIKKNISFRYFCLHASNDMFVKKGLSDFIQKFDAGFNVPVLGSTRWVHFERAQSDWKLKKMMRQYNLPQLLGGQVEGSFYKQEIMSSVTERIMKNGFHEFFKIYAQGTSKFWSGLLNHKYARYLQRRVLKGFLYAKEELYFATLSQDKVQQRAAYNYCYINWLDNLRVTIADIENIRSGNYEKLRFFNQHDFSKGDIEFFAVKRIDRILDNPIRVYINGLQQ